jgi:three-Cys-motif partner protein
MKQLRGRLNSKTVAESWRALPGAQRRLVDARLMVRLGMAIRKHYKGAKVSGKKQKRERGDEVDGKRRDREQLSFAEVENWEIPPISSNSVEIGSLPSPIWTETKAQLIQNYLRLFLFITKHGVYIDGFAGPQDKANPDSWAAKLVLELAPPWMKAFFLCEIKKGSYADILSMLQTQKTIAGRQIVHKHGDFNEWIADVLASGSITDKTATFALLDQRSTECHWSTVEKLAAHKQGSTKIELFYFFPTGWIHRAISETKDKSVLDAWWGDKSWNQLEGISQDQASSLCLKRIQALGYRDVKGWPISSREAGEGRTMYHMIHATDHLEAPKLMFRAYRNLIGGVPAGEQTNFDFDKVSHSDLTRD